MIFPNLKEKLRSPDSFQMYVKKTNLVCCCVNLVPGISSRIKSQATTINDNQSRRWCFSGRILACHAGYRGSTPRQYNTCSFLMLFCSFFCSFLIKFYTGISSLIWPSGWDLMFSPPWPEFDSRQRYICIFM